MGNINLANAPYNQFRNWYDRHRGILILDNLPPVGVSPPTPLQPPIQPPAALPRAVFSIGVGGRSIEIELNPKKLLPIARIIAGLGAALVSVSVEIEISRIMMIPIYTTICSVASIMFLFSFTMQDPGPNQVLSTKQKICYFILPYLMTGALDLFIPAVNSSSTKMMLVVDSAFFIARRFFS